MVIIMKFIKQNSESNYDKEIDSIIDSRKKEIFDFFNVKEFELPFTVYVYDSIEDLVCMMGQVLGLLCFLKDVI